MGSGRRREERHRGKGAGSEEGTHDWLTSGIEGEERPSQWLEDQPLPEGEEPDFTIPSWLKNIAYLFGGSFVFVFIRANGSVDKRFGIALIIATGISLMAFLGYGLFRGVKALLGDKYDLEGEALAVAESIETQVEEGLKQGAALSAAAKAAASEALSKAKGGVGLPERGEPELRFDTADEEHWLRRSIRFVSAWVGVFLFMESLKGGLKGKEFLAVIVVTLGVWGTLSALAWVVRYFKTMVKVFVATVLVPAGAAGGVLVVNPHCLNTSTDDPEVEVPVCMVLSSIEADLDASPWSPYALLGFEQGRGGKVGEDEVSPYLTLESGGAPYGLTVNASNTGDARFHTCMTSLYEAPAKNVETTALTRFHFDHDQAHDIAMGALVNVCERYKKREVADLKTYYWRSATNLMKWRSKRRGWERERWERAALESRCLLESAQGLTEDEMMLLDTLKSRLEPKYQRVINRYLKGGSWREIGQDLGMSWRQAYDQYQYAQRLMHDHLDEKNCQSRPYANDTYRYSY